MPNRISKVGFEIEGGWDGVKGISPFNDITLIADGSINGQSLAPGNLRVTATHVGEAVSPPMDADDQEKWEEWLVSHWPNGPRCGGRTNNTCGYHIHISLKSHLDYSLLTSRQFLFELRDEMLRHARAISLYSKHDFWNRLNGLNKFCRYLANPARQMTIRTKGINPERYGALNFAYNIHGTVEFRLLPTFKDAPVAVGFTRCYFNFVNTWLNNNQPAAPLIREAKF